MDVIISSNLIRVFVGLAEALLGGVANVHRTSCRNLNESALDDMNGFVSAFEILKTLQICLSLSESAFV